MSSILLSLLPEIQENIFRYCTVKELSSLSRCNSVHNAAVREKLWWKVAIPLSSMMQHNFFDTTHTQRNHLIHTRVLRFHVGMLLPENADVYARISDHYAGIVDSLRAENMKELSLDEAFIDDKSLRLTCELLPNLKKFTLVGYTYYKRRLTPSALLNVARLKNLTSLNLHGTHIDDATMTAICRTLLSIEDMDLGCTCITDVSVREFVRMKGLKRLILNECKISQRGLQYISYLTDLKTLDVGGCSSIPPEAFIHFQQLAQLRSLNISKCNINPKALYYVGTMKTLKELNLMACNNLNRDGIVQLNSLNQLTFLDVSRTKISDDSLKEICANHRLRELNISFTAVSDAGMEQVAAMSSLEVLRTSGNNITDAAVTFFSNLNHLKELDLNYCRRFSDIGVVQLVALATFDDLCLECLNIHCTQVTVQGLNELAKVRSLQRLGCSFDSATIRASLPNIEIPNRDFEETNAW